MSFSAAYDTAFDVTATATTTPPAPPDWTAWWDVTAAANAALARLRLTETDVDADWVTELVPVVGQAINAFLDRPDATVPAPIAVLDNALIRGVTDAYQATRAGQGNPDDYSLAALTTRLASVDLLGNVRAQLLPHKRRWGVG